MKIEKNKIVFAAILAVILMFIISYTLMIMDEDDSEDENLEQTLVPELEEKQKVYKSKLDAINDLKEVRETNAPSIYDEKLIDSLGFYDSDLPEKEKERIVDSIYATSRIKYSTDTSNTEEIASLPQKIQEIDSTEQKIEQKIEVQELGLEHQLFFASAPKETEISISPNSGHFIYVVVDGDQVVKANSRLRMRLAKTAIIENQKIPKNTPIYGFVSFQPNRAIIEIENINHHPTKLKAYDIQDGSEGIYVENNIRAEVTTEVLDDIIQDINIPAFPQVSGITKLFKRNNQNVKITVLNNYKLILKPVL